MTARPGPSRAIGETSKAAWLILLLIGLVWGSSFSLAKLATEAGAHPLGISWWQAVIGAVLLLGFLAARRTIPPLSRKHLVFYFVCGALGTAIPSTLYFYAAPRIPAGVISITIATVPILTLALAVLLRLESFEGNRIAGILLGIIAVAMIVGPEGSLPDPEMAGWVLVCIVASSCYALENLWISLKQPPGSGAFVLLAGMLSMAALMLTVPVVTTGTFVSLFKPWGVVEASIVAMALVNAASYGLFIHLVSIAGPVFASQTAYLVTLSGMLWGMAIFAEQHSAWIWGALVLMMAGVALVKPRN